MARSTKSGGSAAFIIIGIVLFLVLISLLFTFTPRPCTKLNAFDIKIYQRYLKDKSPTGNPEISASPDILIRCFGNNVEPAIVGDSTQYNYIKNLADAFSNEVYGFSESFDVTSTDVPNVLRILDGRFLNFLYKLTFPENIRLLNEEVLKDKYENSSIISAQLKDNNNNYNQIANRLYRFFTDQVIVIQSEYNDYLN